MLHLNFKFEIIIYELHPEYVLPPVVQNDGNKDYDRYSDSPGKYAKPQVLINCARIQIIQRYKLSNDQNK